MTHVPTTLTDAAWNQLPIEVLTNELALLND